MTINPFAIPPIMAALLNFILVLWVYLQAPEGRVRRTFLTWNIILGLWNVSIAGGYLMANAEGALLWYRTVVAAVVRFIAPCFLHFVMAITETREDAKNRWILRAAYANAILFLSIGLTTHSLIKHVHHFYWGYYPLAETGEMLFGIPFFAIVIYALSLLHKTIQKSTGYRRNQMKYLFFGAVAYFSGGFTNFLPLYGIDIYPMGNLMNSLYSVLVAYAIIEYGLMDIRLVLRRSAVYALLSGGVTVVYLSMVELFKMVLGPNGMGGHYLYYTAAVPLTVILAPAMKTRLEPLIESAPFWKTYRYSEIFHQFGQSVLTILDLPTAAERVLDQMRSIVDADHGAIYLRVSEGTTYSRILYRGRPGLEFLTDADAVIQHCRRRERFLKEEALWAVGYRGSADDSPMDPIFEACPYSLGLPLFVKEEFLGIVALGDKRTGDMFNEDDIRLMMALAGPAAVALHNARGIADLERHQQTVKKNEEMAFIGVLATEMAHELTKPLTHILNAGARLGQTTTGSSRENLLKIEKEAHRASEILDSFAMLSPHVPLQRLPMPLADLLDEALSLLGIQGDKTIQIVKQYDWKTAAFVNPGQIVQVLTNLIQNAWEAMPDGGGLTLGLHPHDDASGKKWAEIILTDTGPGIPAEIKDRIFEPFVTTKKTRGGRGVGLAISRAMIERHGGVIRIQSPADGNTGTRIVICLPQLPMEDVYEK